MKNLNEILFAKVRESAKIPEKRLEDMGMDIYADFEENFIVIPPHSTVLIPTGIAYAIDESKGIIIKDRGSNGSKGLITSAGVCDSGFRDEIKVVWCNINDRYAVIIKEGVDKGKIEREIKASLKDITINLKIQNESVEATIPNQYADKDIIWYPYEKGIAQLLFVDVLEASTKVVKYQEVKSVSSERGMGMLGSSGK